MKGRVRNVLGRRNSTGMKQPVVRKSMVTRKGFKKTSGCG